MPGDQHTSEVFGQAIEAAIVKGYDAIATVAGDAGLVPFINKAVAAGIPVATFNSETAEPNERMFFVGADLYKQGEAAGKAMGEALGGKGKVAIITGLFAVEAHELRRKGFEDYPQGELPGCPILEAVENQDKADIAYAQANDFMTANPDLAGIYVTAGGPFGAAKAVEEAGKGGARSRWSPSTSSTRPCSTSRRASSPARSGRTRSRRAMTPPSASTTRSWAASSPSA